MRYLPILDKSYAKRLCSPRAIRAIMPMQHADGGFGGNAGHLPHLFSNYAAICCLVIVGQPGPEGGWDQIDRFVPGTPHTMIHVDLVSEQSEDVQFLHVPQATRWLVYRLSWR